MTHAPKFVFASDSLKGTLTSSEAAHLLERAARRHFPGCECVRVPMADGGDLRGNVGVREKTAPAQARRCARIRNRGRGTSSSTPSFTWSG